MARVTFEYIESAVSPEAFAQGGGDGYENAANFACKTVLAVARRDPQAFKVALDAYRANPFTDEIEKLMTRDEQQLLFHGRWGLTGFQWGWAVQTAAWLLEQAPVGNPAIMTISANP